MLECQTHFNLGEESLFWLAILRDHSELMHFMALFFKAYSYLKMIQPRPECRPILSYLNRQAFVTPKDFICYMAMLKKDLERCEVLGILPALLMDHYIREATYYLGKITEYPDPAPSAGPLTGAPPAPA